MNQPKAGTFYRAYKQLVKFSLFSRNTIKHLVFLWGLLCSFILNNVIAAESEATFPISISPAGIHSPYFQTLEQSSSAFDKVNYEIAQDTEGFLWFAGFGGLARYDGYEIREFTHDPDNKHSIAENAIRTISADNNGGLWLSLYNLGLSHYNANTKQFIHIPHDKDNHNSPTSNTIRDIIVLKNDDLWIGGKEGLSYYDSKTKVFTHFSSGTDIKNDNYILDMTIDKQGKLWLSTAKGLKAFDAKSKKIVLPTLLTPDNQLLTTDQQAKLFRKLITTQDGKIWLAGYHENIHVLDPQTNKIFPLTARNKGGKYNHMSISQVNGNEIWVSNLTTGIEVFDANTLKKINHISANNKKAHLLNRINVDVIFKDNSGTIWLSFNGENPQYYNQNLSAYQYLKFDRNVNGEGIFRVLPLSKDTTLVSTFKHLAIFNKNQGSLKELNFPASLEFKNDVWEISELAIGNRDDVWLGLTIPKLIKFNLATQEESYYSFGEIGTKGSATYHINYISEQELLISTSGGAIKFNPQTEQFNSLKTITDKDINARIWRSYKSDLGDYFLSSNEGLFYQLQQQQGFTFIPLNKSTFKGSSVEMVAKGDDDKLWVFTNQTIYQAEIKNQTIILNEIPPPNKNLTIDRLATTVDEQGYLWLGPYTYYDPLKKRYINLSHYNYINKSTFNDMTSLGNTLYVSSDKELLIIDKNKISPLEHQAPIKLSELTSGTRTLKEQKLNEGFTLIDDSQELSAKFTALDFAHANNINYYYRLKGLEDFWRTSSVTERRATYTSIPPGDYKLEIKAQHSSEAVTHKMLSIPVTVLPKLYQTWWFKLALILLLSLFLWLLHKAFLNKAMRREKEERTHQLAIERAAMMEDLMAKKNQLLADVSHELGTPLTVLKLHVESLQDDLEEDVQVTYNALAMKINDIQSLINDIHQLAQSDIGALNLNFYRFELNRTLDEWEKELKQFVQHNKLNFEISRQLPANLMVNFDSERLKQVFTQLLTNSIKYTNKPGKVILAASVVKSTLVLSIEDSAPTVDKDKLSNIFERLYRIENSRSRATGGSGLGLAICKSLIKEHHGKIFAEQSSLGGVKVTIELPINGTA